MAQKAKRIKVALRLNVVDGNTKRSKVKTKLYNNNPPGINKTCNIANHNLLKDMHAYTCINELTSHLKRIIISRVNEHSKQCNI